MDIHTIDWNTIWMKQLSRPFDSQKIEEYWDRRAAGFSRPESQSPYIEQFLQLLALKPDWRELDIKPHEVVIASRSLIVPDLRGAIETLNRFALQRAYISVPAGAGPFDPDLLQAIGRPCRWGPDYISLWPQSLRPQIKRRRRSAPVRGNVRRARL